MTIVEQIRRKKMRHALQQVERQRAGGHYHREFSARTLRLMKDIVDADIAYDIKHGIDYDDGERAGVA